MLPMAGKSLSSFLLTITVYSLRVIHGRSNNTVKIPAIFLFGDSTLDVGTNNFLPNCKAKANSPYYGIDSPGSIPTGRFSNGLHSADEIVKLFGYEMSPSPFLSRPNKTDIQRGVNFASGGSGILNKTGLLNAIQVVSLGEQIQQFGEVQGIITEILGQNATSFLSNSLFIISAGSNDLYEFLAANSNKTSRKTTMDALLDTIHSGASDPSAIADPTCFLSSLQSTYQLHLKSLYKLGARKFGIVSMPPVGCCPAVRAHNKKPGDGCVTLLNEIAQAFHMALDCLLVGLSEDLEGMKYSLGNAYKISSHVRNNPTSYGIKNVDSGCCGSGKFNGEGGCNNATTTNLCKNRTQYLYWDMCHPTETASKLVASFLYSGGLEFVSPMNLSQLAAMVA